MEWKTVKLGDILNITGGQLYKGELLGKGNNLLLGMGCVSFTDKFLMKGARQYGGDCLEKNIGHPGDIVLATRQQSDNMPILAMPAMIPEGLDAEKIIIGSNLYKVNITDSEIDNRFIFWLLKTPEYVNYIASVKTGTTVKMITIKDVENYTFSCPPKSVRDKISNILWTLDAKIENNNRINANLEAQAQALYKSWFVDFEPWGGKMPENWKEGKLTDIAELFDSKRIPLSGMQRSKMEKIYPYYGATSIMDYVDNYIFDGIYLLMGEDGSVVTEDGFPYLQYVEGKFWCNNHAHIMQGRNGYSTEMLYCLLKQTKVAGIITGAVQGKISQASMQKIQCVIPPQNICERMTKCMDVFFELIRMINKESQRLAQLRDTLLPKLMKGEIEL